ncbi:hypothetical protein UFOVP204_174 [uncultured Caudovirales phage]|uniref:Uncharacterized protein n=1 Tax=uncultured Caudovirales phage TaxID=2100421 RepID=A0A6J7WNL6_9CAUD|nr:hypothetical protein UFOVP204_174 [uncultured Caudovirales phage]
MATVDKNFRIKNGLVVEGTTGTINGNNILTENAGDSYILNLVGGATLVKSVDSATFTVDGSGNLTVNSGVFDAYGAASSAQTAAQSYADGLASNYDAAGAASAAQTAAQSYADSLAGNYDAAGAAATAESNANIYTDGQITSALTTAQGYATTAQGNAESYADGVGTSAVSSANSYTDSSISTEVTNRNTAISDAVGSATTTIESYADTAASNALSSANTYTDGKVADLVGMAPSLLDTLEKIDAAIANDANFSTTLLNDIATAQSTAESYTDTAISTEVTNRNSAIATAKTEAITAAESYADGLAGNYDAAGSASTAYTNALNDANGYTDGYVGALKDGTEAFTDINLNNVTSQRAVQTTLSSVTSGSSVMSWAKADYGSAKLWVKFATATHSQISEVLITTDAANNVAITEFAIVGTNGNMGSVTATYLAGNLAVEVDTVYANTTVTVSATLIK